MNWEPIETAPKDGTRVLLKTHTGVHLGYWADAPVQTDGKQEKDSSYFHWVSFVCPDYYYSVHLIDDEYEEGEPFQWMHIPK